MDFLTPQWDIKVLQYCYDWTLQALEVVGRLRWLILSIVLILHNVVKSLDNFFRWPVSLTWWDCNSKVLKWAVNFANPVNCLQVINLHIFWCRVDGGVGDRRRTTGAVPQQSLCVVLEAVGPHIHQWVALKTNNDPLSMLNAGRPSSMILSWGRVWLLAAIMVSLLNSPQVLWI